jgi:cell division transport system permease protein
VRGSSFGYLVREGARNIYANRTMSAAAIGVLVCCLLLIGCAVLLSLNVDSILGYVESQNEVVLFLNDDIDDELLSSWTRNCGRWKPDRSVFVSREEGLIEWMETLDNGDQLLACWPATIRYPNSYRVKIKVLEDMDVVLMDLRGLHGVDQVNAPVEVAEAILNLRSVLTVGRRGGDLYSGGGFAGHVATHHPFTVFNRRRRSAS